VRKILCNRKTAGLRNVQNCLRISGYNGTAKNLRDPLFREKTENLGKIGQLEERARHDLLSAFVNMGVNSPPDTAHFVCFFFIWANRNFSLTLPFSGGEDAARRQRPFAH
jgi:hypothetical protein